MDALQKIISEREINYVLVGLDFEVPLFAKYKALLEKKTDCKVVVSSVEVVKICNDKWLTYCFLRDSGFDVPNTCLPDSLDEFMKSTPFPWIVKPRVGSTSKGLYRIDNLENLNRALENCDDPIVQEEVGDIEESSHVAWS